MNTIQIGASTFKTKSTWNDLTRADLLLWGRCIVAGLDIDTALHRVAFRMSGIPFWHYFKLNRIQQFKVEAKFRFLTDDNTLSRILLPAIRVGFKKYYAPVDEFRNLTVEEFVEADSAFKKHVKNKKEQNLEKLIAILYREGRPAHERVTEGDARIPFNKYTVGARAIKMAKLRAATKHAILLQYMGIRKLMMKSYPNVFSGRTQKKVKNFGWPGVITDLAGPEYGTDLAIQKRMIWDILFIMEKNEVRRMEHEKNNPKK